MIRYSVDILAVKNEYQNINDNELSQYTIESLFAEIESVEELVYA